MNLTTETAQLSEVVRSIYDRLIKKRYHEAVFRGIAYRGLGANLVGVCPFHSESSTPSLLIEGSNPIWKCFAGCGGGTWIRWLQLREGLTFWDALDKLALAAEIDLRHFALYERWKRETDQAEIYESVVKFLRSELTHERGKHVRDYLSSRKISSIQIHAMEIGALTDPALLADFLEGQDFDKDLLYGNPRTGLPGAFLNVTKLSPNRVVIPFRDEIGRIYTLFTRVADPAINRAGGKYDPIVPTSDERRVLYNLWTLYGTDTVTLVEGAFDCVRATIAGFSNVTATNGVNVLPSHLETLRRSGIKRVFIVPDTDKAGVETTAKTVDILAREGFESFVVELPREFKDVDGLLAELGEVGTELLRRALLAARPGMAWKARELTREFKESGRISELEEAALGYSTGIARPEDAVLFLLEVMSCSEITLSGFEKTLELLAEKRLPIIRRHEYLQAARAAVAALNSGNEAGYHAAIAQMKR